MEYGLIGAKLGHSYSKQIHEQICGYTYELKELSESELDPFMRERSFSGINVTIPYKQDVIPYLDHVDPEAAKIGAVNTVVNRNGKLYGYNTDFYGLKQMMEQEGFDPAGKKVLILGSGGTSRTARAVCEALQARQILTVSRKKTSDPGMISYEELPAHADADCLINTTPIGMYPNMDAEPVDLSVFRDLRSVVDVIYNPLRTRLVLDAQSRGIRACGGLKMLIGQAVVAAGLFTGENIQESKGISAYRSVFNERSNIVLTGMPGAGKSTVGKMLAQKLDRTFIDTDEEIVRREGCSIPEIFSSRGEAAFRQMEVKTAQELMEKAHCVIATGGGFLLDPVCERAMKAYGTVFFLNRDPSGIRPTDDRPLADDPEKIAALYRQRLPRYQELADHTVPVEGEPSDVCAAIMQILEEE